MGPKQLAAEMRKVYPAAAAQLVDLFQRMAECDRECSRIPGSAPYGDGRRLRGGGIMQPLHYWRTVRKVEVAEL